MTPTSTSCWPPPASAAPTASWSRSRHTSTPASPKHKARSAAPDCSWRSRLAEPRQPPGRPQTPRRPPRGHRRTGPGRHPEPSQDHLVDHAAPGDAHRKRELARAFADMVRHQRGYHLLEWIRQAEQDAPKPMKGFAGFLRQDLDAVTAGLTLPWSSGVVEVHVNRVKTLERAMYGRASFELLRTRILTQP
ncbi:transposase [Streptomyces sp. NPDC046931]|uniref:transposase n=1 Tax=Streptomyces sp. NPDC046931 TaxID=3154806 RepID=UPI0033FEE243